MSKFKIGDKVRITGDKTDSTGHLDGKVGKVVDVSNKDIMVEVEGDPILWFIWNYNAELVNLVEDKKVFTKSDLKTGDVIVRRDGDVEIAIVELGVFVRQECWDDFDEINEDLTDNDDFSECDIVKVYRPNEKYQCSFDVIAYTEGNLIYDREGDTKPKEPNEPNEVNEPTKTLYNGKVICVDLCGCNKTLYTVGKIYEFKGGYLITDNGEMFPCNPVHTFEEWNEWTGSKFIEVKE